MDNELKVFESDGFGKMRAVEIDGKPWWVLADVCRVLELSNPTMVASRLSEDERTKVDLGRQGKTTVVNESGLRKVVMRSNKPAAEPFMRWINEEMLPALHKQDTPEPVAAEGLMALSYKGSSVRMQMIGGEPWWALPDVCGVLEIGNPSDVAKRLDDDEKMTLDLTDGHSGMRGGAQRMTIVNEPGLYSVIMRSDKPEAKEFKRWVTHEVLPSIRKTGSYTVGQEMLALPKDYASALRALADSVEKNAELEKQNAALESENAIMQPKAVFADIVQKSTDNIYMADMAKLLCENGIKTGQKRLYNLLRNVGVLQANNMPYQRYIDQDYFKVKESYYEDPKGRVYLTRTTLVTPKGQVWLANNVQKWMDQLGM